MHRLLNLLLMIALIVANTSVAKEPVVPVFKDGQAQIVQGFKDPEFWIRHDLWVETESDSDGDGKPDRMHVAVTRQQQTESEGLKVPAVYISSPYFAGTAKDDQEYFWSPRHEIGVIPPAHANPPKIEPKSRRPIISKTHVKDWVPRGYAVVHSSSPGTGLSEGCPTVGGINESLAPKAVINWLCGRGKGYASVDGNDQVTADWCTGKVAMTGTSYNGTIPLAAASTGVQGLEAIIPIAPNTSYYHYYRSNGLVRHPGGYMGEDIDVLYNFIHSGNANQADYCDCNIRDIELAKGMDRQNADYNDFWAGRDYLNQIQNVTAATLLVHGLNDWNVMPEHSVRIYQALNARGARCQAFFHQGGHGGAPPMKLMNRWLTRYLFDVQNDVEKDPKAWIVREDAENSEPTPYADYPNPNSAAVTLHPSTSGNQTGKLMMNKPPPQGTESLVDNYSFAGGSLAQAQWTDHRLLYSTKKLTKPMHLSGTASVSIRLSSSKPAANLSVWLVSLPWNTSDKSTINDNLITRGWADPQNHKSLTESSPLVPGEFYDLSFDLQPDDQVIPAGQSIGLMIFSSDKEFTLWPDPGTKLTIDLDHTELILPVVGGADALDSALNKP